jgi:hypothetical protein
MTPIAFSGDWHAAAEAVAPYAAQVTGAWVPVIVVVVAGVLRLLMEWQLRRTLTAIFQQAPGGSVIVIRKRGLGGAMWIHVDPGGSPGRAWHST